MQHGQLPAATTTRRARRDVDGTAHRLPLVCWVQGNGCSAARRWRCGTVGGQGCAYLGRLNPELNWQPQFLRRAAAQRRLTAVGGNMAAAADTARSWIVRVGSGAWQVGAGCVPVSTTPVLSCELFCPFSGTRSMRHGLQPPAQARAHADTLSIATAAQLRGVRGRAGTANARCTAPCVAGRFVCDGTRGGRIKQGARPKADGTAGTHSRHGTACASFARERVVAEAARLRVAARSTQTADRKAQRYLAATADVP